MRLGTAIEHLVEAYKYASDKEWIQDKVAWALYHTWKEADRKTEPSSSEIPNSSTISKMEQVDEPQTMYYPQVDGITPSLIVKDEPQTEKCDRPQMDCENCWKELHCRVKDEPQTEDAYAYDEDDWYDKAEREGE